MAQYGIKEVMDFTLTNYHRNPYKRRPIVFVDYAQLTSMEVSSERVEVTGGRGNRTLLSFDHSKTSRFNLTLPLVDLKLLALISGDEVEEKIREIYLRDVLNIEESDDGRKYVKLTRKPIINSIHLYNLDNCKDFGDKICPALTEESVQLEMGEYLVDEDDPTILWLHEDHAPESDTMIAYYHYKTEDKVTSMRINPEKFPRDISFYGEALWRNECSGCDEVYHVVGHRGKILPNYELSMSGTDVAVLELTLEMYAVNDPTDNTPVYIEYIKDDHQTCEMDEEDPCDIDDDGEEVPTEPEEKPEIEVSTEEELQNALQDNTKETIKIKEDIEVNSMLELMRPVHIDGQGNTITYNNNTRASVVKYVAQAYRTQGVTISNLTLAGGDAGLYVNGAEVKIENLIIENEGLGGIEVSQGAGVVEEPKLTVDEDSKYINNKEQMPFIWIDGKTTNDGFVGGHIARLFSYPNEEKNQLHYYMEKFEIPVEPEEPKFEDGEIEAIRIYDGDNEDVNPFGAIAPRIVLGQYDDKFLQVKDLSGMKVTILKDKDELATNTLQMDKLDEKVLGGTAISCPFNLGRTKIDKQWAWIRGVYKTKGDTPTEADLPNTVKVELELPNGKTNTFVLPLDEDEVKMPKPFVKPEEIEKKTKTTKK